MRERHVEDEVVEVLSSGDTVERPTEPAASSPAEHEPEA